MSRSRWRRRSPLPGRSREHVAAMRAAGLVVARTLAALRAAVAPGVSTADLDELAREHLRMEGATPSFLGYQGFPAVICTSVNDEVVHGIPDRAHVLRTGDVVSVDCGAIVDGWHGDAAITVGVGDVAPPVAALLRTTEEALWAALDSVRVGATLGDIGAAVERVVRPAGYGIVEELTGHGIGRSMHEAPAVPNRGRAGHGPALSLGTTLAIEPMVTLGRRHVAELPDGWTVVTRDGQPAAHFEHTVALTEEGPWVLTALDEETERWVKAGRCATAPRSGADGMR